MPDSESTFIKIDLYYKGELIETRAVGIVSPVGAEITFPYEIDDIPKDKSTIKKLFEEARIEPNYTTRGYKFERVIRAVISLVPDLKVTSRNVYDRIEEIDIQVRNHNRKHVWADFDDVFF